jgi:hypothetical protein
MVERPPEQGMRCVKRIAQPSTDSGIEEAADSEEQAGRMRPGDIVQVASDDDRVRSILDFLGNQNQFRVSLDRVYTHMWWPGVNTVKFEVISGSQPNKTRERGNILLHSKAHSWLGDWQARIEEHTVCVAQWAFDRVRVLLFYRPQAVFPVRVGLRENDKIRPLSVNNVKILFDIPVGHQNVGG